MFDLIAILPLIGSLKYVKHAGDVGDIAKHVDDIVEETRNIIKNSDEAGDALKSTVKGSAIRDELLSKVSNEKLRNCINEIYRKGASVGDGGLSDAIRHEITTGELVGGKSHIQKGIERVKNLENIIERQNLNATDLKIANDLLNDLKSALALGGY